MFEFWSHTDHTKQHKHRVMVIKQIMFISNQEVSNLLISSHSNKALPSIYNPFTPFLITDILPIFTRMSPAPVA